MAPMHWRTLLKRPPFYENSRHIVANERTVTNMEGKYQGETLSYYVVQIAGKSVNGIDSYFNPEEKVTQRRGLRHDPHRLASGLGGAAPARDEIMVQPGDKVRAGETVLIA